jgi:hypothetical protein
MPTGGAVRGAAATLTFAPGRTVTALPDDAAEVATDGSDPAPRQAEEDHQS